MKSYTIIDDLINTDVDQNESMRKVKRFIDACQPIDDLPILSVTFTKEEWDALWGKND